MTPILSMLIEISIYGMRTCHGNIALESKTLFSFYDSYCWQLGLMQRIPPDVDVLYSQPLYTEQKQNGRQFFIFIIGSVSKLFIVVATLQYFSTTTVQFQPPANF